jgi:hypothetical protein
VIEAEWLACTDPELLAIRVRPVASERKLRLFTCACCRRIWDQIADERSRKCVEIAEAFADGQATGRERARAHTAAGHACDGSSRWAYAAAECAVKNCKGGIAYLGQHAALAMGSGRYSHRRSPGPIGDQVAAERAFQAILFRDIFNPFQPLALEPRWLTSNVVDLARTVYDERAFDHLPILADALMDAGCTDEHILNHCRSDGPHVRGCWVVDLILAKQ